MNHLLQMLARLPEQVVFPLYGQLFTPVNGPIRTNKTCELWSLKAPYAIWPLLSSFIVRVILETF